MRKWVSLAVVAVIWLPLTTGCSKKKKDENTTTFTAKEPSAVTVKIGAEADVSLEITRQTKFTKEVAVKIEAPEGVKAPQKLTIPKGESKVKLTLGLTDKAKPGEQKVKITFAADKTEVTKDLVVTIAPSITPPKVADNKVEQKRVALMEKVSMGLKQIKTTMTGVKTKLDTISKTAPKVEVDGLKTTLKTLDEKKKVLQSQLAQLSKDGVNWTEKMIQDQSTMIEENISKLEELLKNLGGQK